LLSAALPPAGSLALAEGLLDSLEVDLRLSVMYQPEPLKTIPAGKSTRRTLPPQRGHSVIGASANR
jgi:hypothetical protein